MGQRIAIGLALCLLAAGCAPQGRNAIQADGFQNELPKVVSLNPCLDSILVEIADPDQVLALSHYSSDPASSSISRSAAEGYRFTGGTVEEVIDLAPDIVLASTLINPNAQSAFAQLGIEVVTFDSPTTIAQSRDQVQRMAQLVGQQGRGDAMVKRIMGPSTGPALQGDPVSVMLWQPGEIVPGEQTLIHQLLQESGFENHSARRGLGQASHVSLESLLADPPELVLVAGGSRGQLHPLLNELEATQVESFDPRLFYCGGPAIAAARARLLEIRGGLR